MNKKRYVTIFPECEEVHLKKDVGMLPYSLGKYCNYEFSIVCYEGLFDEKNIEKFHIKQIPKKRNDVLDFGMYILKYGRQIDILNLYHISSRRNVFWIFVYKLVNPKGKIHVKLDADYRMVELVDMDPKSFKGKVKAHILRNKVDLYTVESKRMRELLENKWKLKMKVIPNGIFREREIDAPKSEEKENLFLTVGRLGTEQKATQDLLEAYVLIKDKTNWKLWLVGTMEKTFVRYLENYFVKNPELRKRIIVEGNVSDNNRLTEIYKRAKVFILPSKWESFGLVLMEALECGEYLIVSDQIPSIDDIGKSGEYASVVKYNDVEELANEMLAVTQKDVTDRELQERNKWIRNNFTWRVIVRKLDKYLNEL